MSRKEREESLVALPANRCILNNQNKCFVHRTHNKSWRGEDGGASSVRVFSLFLFGFRCYPASCLKLRAINSVIAFAPLSEEVLFADDPAHCVAATQRDSTFRRPEHHNYAIDPRLSPCFVSLL